MSSPAKKKSAGPNLMLFAVLGIVLGVGAGVGSFWTAAKKLVAAARVAQAAAHTPAQPEAPWDFWTVEMEALAQELKDAKDGLKAREESLTQREGRLSAERVELARQRQQIEQMRQQLSGYLLEITTEEMKNIKPLAATYSSLSPKAVLTIFKEMDDATVVKLLSIMKTDVVAPLFEEMTKQAVADPTIAKRVAHLSEKLRLLKSTKTAGP